MKNTTLNIGNNKVTLPADISPRFAAYCTQNTLNIIDRILKGGCSENVTLLELSNRFSGIITDAYRYGNYPGLSTVDRCSPEPNEWSHEEKQTIGHIYDNTVHTLELYEALRTKTGVYDALITFLCEWDSVLRDLESCVVLENVFRSATVFTCAQIGSMIGGYTIETVNLYNALLDLGAALNSANRALKQTKE